MIFSNDKAIYIQIADRLCDEILAGKYKDDDRIPSVREYAVLLEVNTNTAVKAYDELARANIIYNKRGLGYFVTKGAKKQIMKDIAVKNSEYAGAISPVAAAYEELYAYYTEDEDGLFSEQDVASGWKDMFLETMFPSADTLNRCGVMKDFGDGKSRVTEMWSNVQ